MSDPVRAWIKKLVKAGVFDGVGRNATKTTVASQPSKQKWGTANVVVEEQNGGEEMEVKEDGMPPKSIFFKCLACQNVNWQCQ